ncbi:dihydroorotase [Enhydrobacter aerosaccus]|uniref:Dihydroorotase n=1 Tax=Enhydrobacter aerosaccus TaxID=225324 RepID=A0A1T4KN61_9HYPH|nr:dihydroorotase [Enhydrobacter aerosaccus]SJZ43827.1 dihydroorotase [Enhydrobacter aerosaccus]
MSGDILRGVPPHAGSTAYINARIIDPTADSEYTGAILISDGKIADFGPNLFASGAPYGIQSVDCRGLYLAPGIVDTRVHTGEPGEEHKETLDSAGVAAAVGGITSLVLLPDTEPPFDDASLIEFVARRARQIKLANMYAYGALTVGLEGKELAEIGLLAEAGAVGFTDADHAVGNAQVMRRALYYAKAFDALIVHLPQEPTLSSGHMSSGLMATRLGLSGNPPLAEVMMVERDIRLAEMTGGRLHLTKISTAESVKVIAAAKARGLKITCDTAAPYFALNDLAVGDYRTFGKLVPPLRGEADREAIVEGLKSGVIDAIVSDHRPQDQDSKRVPFAQAEPGGIGLETLLPVSLELTHNGHLTLPQLFQRLSSAPARLFNLPGGKLAKGAPADLVIFDSSLAWKIDRTDLWSKTKNSPFDERPVQGKVMATIVGGRTIYRDDRFVPAVAA